MSSRKPCDYGRVAGFVRFQSAIRSPSGRFPGVFGLANGLAREAALSVDDAVWWRAANDRMTAAYVDPSTVDPLCYDPVLHPGARAWFKDDAHALIAMTREYLALLDRYGVAWIELRTADPGEVVYEDDVQAVAVPRTVTAGAQPDPEGWMP